MNFSLYVVSLQNMSYNFSRSQFLKWRAATERHSSPHLPVIASENLATSGKMAPPPADPQ
jgi:hypothetical protein